MSHTFSSRFMIAQHPYMLMCKRFFFITAANNITSKFTFSVNVIFLLSNRTVGLCEVTPILNYTFVLESVTAVKNNTNGA